MACIEAVKEIIWLQELLGELGIKHNHMKVHCESSLLCKDEASMLTTTLYEKSLEKVDL